MSRGSRIVKIAGVGKIFFAKWAPKSGYVRLFMVIPRKHIYNFVLWPSLLALRDTIVAWFSQRHPLGTLSKLRQSR